MSPQSPPWRTSFVSDNSYPSVAPNATMQVTSRRARIPILSGLCLPVLQAVLLCTAQYLNKIVLAFMVVPYVLISLRCAYSTTPPAL